MSDWAETTLGKEFEIIMGQSPSSKFYNDRGQGMPFFQGKKEFGEIYPQVEKWTTQATKKADKNDVLLSVRAPIGAVNIAPEHCGIGRGLAAIKPNEQASNRFIFYLVKSKENQLKKRGAGVTFTAITKPNLNSLPIKIPKERNEREKIVEAIETQFTRLDGAIKSLKLIRNKLEFYRRSILKAAFVKKSHWTEKSFVDCFRSASLGDKKIKQRNYLEEGEYPVVDQGERLIGGYTNNKEKLQDIALPAIIFGDHTRRFKYIDFKFAVGADGVKLLKIADFLFPKFAFYHSLILDLPNKGYSRHFQYLKKAIIRFPSSFEEQQEVVRTVESHLSVIDKVEEVVDNALLKADRLRKSILKAAFEGKLVN